MAARILMVVAVLTALYGCGQSPEIKDSFQGVEPLDPEASAFSTVVLTGQNVELESDVVEQADRDDRRPAYAYLECGYAGPCGTNTPSATASASPSATVSASALASGSDPRYEDFKPTTQLVFTVPVIGPVVAVVLILIE